MRLVLTIFIFCLSLTGFTQPYFQQHVKFDIKAVLNDKDHTISCFEELVYTNNSPDELPFIYFHLWPNAYKNDQTALAKQMNENENWGFYHAAKEDLGYIDSLDFHVDGQKVEWALDSQYIDICKIQLKEPLKPGAKITITTPFKVKFPVGTISRLGHLGESYQATQWYPKPAVYDRDGWHQMPYLNQGEFYSEFGSYDVSITLPKNYVVGATGDMGTSEDDIAEVAWLNKKAADTKKIENYPTDNLFPPSDKEMKRLTFHQDNVHDFAWFADKRFHVLKGEVQLPESKETVTTWAMYTNAEPEIWKESIMYLDSSVYYYSLWNGDYPYKHCTAVEGALSAGGGMEYPNVTIIGYSGSAFALETVIMHEVGHNWFYGILGSNERDHPWMDEGLNSFNENRYIETRHPDKKLLGLDGYENNYYNWFDLQHYQYKAQAYQGYLLAARQNVDQPIEHHSAKYTSANYGLIVYGKSSLVFDYLMAYLGEEMTDQIFHEYFDTWKFKHPQPDDLRGIAEKISKKDLTWLFDDFIKTNKWLDYKIISAKRKEATIHVKVRNKGEVNGPFSLSTIKDGNITSTTWFDGVEGSTVVEIPATDYDVIKIDATNDMPETNRKNNSIKAKGLFKRAEPLRLQFAASIENPDKTQLFYMPMAGYNAYNKVMVGAAFYNTVLPNRRFEFVAAPMFGFGTLSPTGMAKVSLNYFPEHIFKKLSFGTYAQSFAYAAEDDQFASYVKIAPSIKGIFHKSNPRNTHYHELELRPNYIMTDNGHMETPVSSAELYVNLRQYYKNERVDNPYDFSTTAQWHESFLKVELEGKYTINMSAGSDLDIRGFLGTFIYNNSNQGLYNFTMDGQGASRSGSRDYTADHFLIGRTETSGLWANQMVANQGGFNVPAANGQSNSLLAAVNIEYDLPIPLPVSIYANMGMSQGRRSDGTTTDANLLYDAGLTFRVSDDIFEIHFPLVFSESIANYHSANGMKYNKLIRFTFNLQAMNPFNLTNDFAF